MAVGIYIFESYKSVEVVCLAFDEADLKVDWYKVCITADACHINITALLVGLRLIQKFLVDEKVLLLLHRSKPCRDSFRMHEIHFRTLLLWTVQVR